MGMFDTDWGATAASTREAFRLAGGAQPAYADLAPADWTRLTANDLGFHGGLFAGTMNSAGYFHGGVQWAGDPAAAVYQDGDRLAVTFRSADNAGDWADATTIPSGLYLSAFNRFLNSVANYAENHGISNITVTGASLGGAVSNLLRDASATDYGGVFADAHYYAVASPYIADDPKIVNFGYENDVIFKSLNLSLGQGVSSFPSTTDNVIYYNDDYANSDWTPLSTSAHSGAAFEDGANRIFSSPFYPLMHQDSLVIISDTDTVRYDQLHGRSNAFGQDAFMLGRAADDVLVGGAHNDSIDARAGDDRIVAGGGNDWVIAGAGNDTVAGGGGNDRLWGGAGNDILFGAAGNDTLNGGSGHDILFGGTGDDTFVWMAASGTERIADFSTGDTIEFARQPNLSSFGDVLNAATELNDSTVITVGHDHLVLVGVHLAALQAADFDILA